MWLREVCCVGWRGRCVKVLVLAVIGSSLLSQLTAGFRGNQPTIQDGVSLVLAALCLLGLGIFGPGTRPVLFPAVRKLGEGAADKRSSPSSSLASRQTSPVKSAPMEESIICPNRLSCDFHKRGNKICRKSHNHRLNCHYSYIGPAVWNMMRRKGYNYSCTDQC
jgi:hypothetical protein